MKKTILSLTLFMFLAAGACNAEEAGVPAGDDTTSKPAASEAAGQEIRPAGEAQAEPLDEAGAASGAEAKQAPMKDTAAFQGKLASAKDMVEKAGALKEQNDPAWKNTADEALRELMLLRRENPASPEVYFLMAKCFRYKGSHRKALRSSEKAVYLNPSYADGLILRGDLLMEEVREKVGPDTRPEEIESNYFYNFRNAKYSYEKALGAEGLDKETEGLIYLRLGDLTALFYPSKEKEAKELWQKAAAASPDGNSGRLAAQRLRKK